MSVFISHRSTDSLLAMNIYGCLTRKGIECYIDKLDPNISPDNATKVILDNLGRCTHLIAVISASTAESWWVPFEIGVATEKENRIASYNSQSLSLPQYLGMWPIMRSMDDLEKFASLYSLDKRVLIQQSKVHEANTTNVRTAVDFHNQLKFKLGQR